MARFEREARILASLSHPNIVTIHEIISYENRKCIVMEYIAGNSLEHLIDSRELGLQDAQRYGAQIAEALAAAHDAGIIHRDLKPTNIMVTDSGQVKVLDFGVAKPSETAASADTRADTLGSTRPGFLVGTVSYMSPEQVHGRTLDRRSDIFSLGLVLYEMIARARAFRGHSQIELMNAILKDTPADLPESVPTALRRIVAVCLEKNPANRFESAPDVAFALRAVCTGSGAVPVVPPAESSAPSDRRLRLPVYAALALSVIVAMVFAALYFSPSPVPLDLASYDYTPFATDQAYETNGIWSRDGRSIGYLKQTDGLLQLMVRGLDSPSPSQLARAHRIFENANLASPPAFT